MVNAEMLTAYRDRAYRDAMDRAQARRTARRAELAQAVPLRDALRLVSGETDGAVVGSLRSLPSDIRAAIVAALQEM